MKSLKKVFLVFIALLMSYSLTACQDEEESSGVVDITAELKLTKEYAGKSFLTGGIGSATLEESGDGDTAEFKLSTGQNVRVRFQGIDTPESTGQVQKWGKAASKFTSEILDSAAEIVLEATNIPAEMDSYNSRYMGYVWYRPTEGADFRLLNLEVVQNGYSKVSTVFSQYQDYFNRAQEQAKENQIHIWSNDEDPLFPTEVNEMTLEELVKNQEEYLDKKVRVEAYIKSTYDKYLYIESVGSDGKLYSYTVYRHNSVATFFEKGNLISVMGFVQTYNGNYQLSGLTVVNIPITEEQKRDNTTLVTEGYFLEFGKKTTISGYDFDKVSVANNVELKDNILTIFGTTSSERQKIVEVEIRVPIGENETVNPNDYMFKKLKLSGYCEDGCKKDNTSIVVEVISLSSIIK